MTSKRTKSHEDAHIRVIGRLKDNPEMSWRELADTASVSFGGIHDVLDDLIDRRLVRLRNFTAAQDKRRYGYIVTAKGLSEKPAITRRFLARKMEQYEALKAEIIDLSSDIENAVEVLSDRVAFVRSVI